MQSTQLRLTLGLHRYSGGLVAAAVSFCAVHALAADSRHIGVVPFAGKPTALVNRAQGAAIRSLGASGKVERLTTAKRSDPIPAGYDVMVTGVAGGGVLYIDVRGATTQAVDKLALPLRGNQLDEPTLHALNRVAPVAKRMREAHELCDENKDIGTASLLEVFTDETERRAWFLFESSQTEGRA